jgi:poly(A) polymerase
MQPRFERRTPSSAQVLVSQPRFRAGYDFLRLRADCGEVKSELADWWEDFHLGSDEEREALLRDVKPTPQRVRRGPATAGAGDSDSAPQAAAAEPADAPPGEADTEAASAPRKRRRRRRRPAGAGEAQTTTPSE